MAGEHLIAPPFLIKEDAEVSLCGGVQNQTVCGSEVAKFHSADSGPLPCVRAHTPVFELTCAPSHALAGQ